MRKFMLVLLFFTLACERYEERKGIEEVIVSSQTNVHFTFHKNGYETIENRNDYPVRIRKIVYGKGEFTKYIQLVKPQGEIQGWTGEHQSVGFYISNINGAEIGFVNHSGGE